MSRYTTHHHQTRYESARMLLACLRISFLVVLANRSRQPKASALARTYFRAEVIIDGSRRCSMRMTYWRAGLQVFAADQVEDRR